jgi:hypothetical protein
VCECVCECVSVCVFITAVPIIKLFAWGEGCVGLLGQTFQVMSLKRRIAAKVYSPSRRTNSDGEQILGSPVQCK